MKGHVGELNKHSKQFGGSKTDGGQVRIHHTVEGDRRNGVNDRRDYKSPLGNTDEGYSTGNEIVQEARNRAQTPISRSGVLDRFHNGGKGPI
jgi:hypothetical protein